jgi:hypothetical protein
MAAITPVLSNSPNRRRRVRHRIQTPAYASFTTESKSAMLDLHEIVNISEDGVAIQCSSSLQVSRRVELCLDLAECDDHIYTTAQVIWTDTSGRAGLVFSELSPVSLFRLREWLFLNAMTGAASASESALAASTASLHVPMRPSYSDTLAAVSAVQRQVETLGADLPAVLRLISDRSLGLLSASGAAIALSSADPESMECRASSGSIAPPVGARLQVGSGFSGECVKSGILLRCDDTETDSRVDRESCRALGVRSMLAVPIRKGDKSIGIIETFSSHPYAFTENDGRILQRLSEIVVAAINRVSFDESLSLPRKALTESNYTPAGGVLFASTPNPEKSEKKASDESQGPSAHGISLPRSLLIVLISLAITIPTAMGYALAPWIQKDVAPWIQKKLHAHASTQLPTVLASSQAPKPSIETASFDQLKQMADNGDPAAENAIGLRYFQGDAKDQIPQDEKQAFRWFSSSAEAGNLAAQSKLGFLYWSGRGAPKDLNKAYFWTVLARARGDEGSRDLATVLASGMTRAQAAAIEQQADIWLQQHQVLAVAKPSAGR